ncbi:oxygen-independent coproporphyrinogen-3 oxidase [Chitinophaga costaii]|uniref:Heme chaperone HemW n=1 Tax=Chitinophaga costaii TaxID=1335309 RepID=A0A1C4B3Q6_9BACT|nr:radical SAM family heme chaperone HemW [Chitinophaga costaii]PUZ26892.1 coproporphyrinogen III oxidase family protein [Chitinophaga costaii]SCC01322.1 oxygen-independent coproporphyrinogen-3 oxidase [Chitinophaga costaii]
MAGIYIHIPFCKQACYYCNFHFSTSRSQQGAMVSALEAELLLQKDYLADQTVTSIYFGGGTPSLLLPEELQHLLAQCRQLFQLPPHPEITLEANPDDLSREKLQALRAAGINRLSIGVQSFHEEDLRWMNRAHNATQAIQSIRDAQAEGFENITIDLIYGGPTLSDEGWAQNLEQVKALNIPHLSSYALTVEPGTALDHFIRQHKVQAVDPDKAARHFETLMTWAADNGYEHYEISNFARTGWHSRHNSSYWQGQPYLGIGPSAHSFNGHSRQWNVSNNAGYLQVIQGQSVPFEMEILTPTIRLNEYLMTSLRTAQGASLAFIGATFGQDKVQHLEAAVAPYVASGKMHPVTDWLRLTNAGKLFADGIAADLFFS